jgi:hypothetical protein
MPDELVNKLQKYFGFNDFLKGQHEVIHLLTNKESAAALTKFLCGINSPMFMKRKIKQLPEYGRKKRGQSKNCFQGSLQLKLACFF